MNSQFSMLNAQFHHVPVMLSAVIGWLAPRSGGQYVDGTLGGGGHALAVLAASTPDGRLLGIDADPAALAATAKRIEPYAARATLVHGNFGDMQRIAAEAGVTKADGILLDLGVSSHQFDTPERGFSFQNDAPLDMRLDPTAETTAADMVNETDEDELADIIYKYGEERGSRRIARFIAEARRTQTIETTGQLAEIVARALGGRHGKLHPATRTFQALRIAVNDELGQLEAVLPQAVELLKPGGRVAIIAFHSLEDRIVKQFFRAEAGRDGSGDERPVRLKILTTKPVIAGPEETRSNPRSRSAKLRVAERIRDTDT